MRAITHHYELFGLHLAVSGSLGGLPLRTIDERTNPDVTVVLERHDAVATPRDAALFHERAIGDETLEIWRREDVYFWVFPDDTRFAVDVTTSHIRVSWPEHFVVEDAVTYLVGPVLGFVLRSRGERPLHGSCVSTDAGAVVILGPAGAGKSTLAAAATSRDWDLIAEDVSVVTPGDGGYQVAPGLGFVKLWPASARRFGDLARLTPNWDKRYLSTGLVASSTRLREICVLERGEAIRKLRLPMREALTHVLANLYVPYLLDRAARRDDLAFFSELVEHVPVCRLTRTDRFEDLESLVDALEATDA